MSDFGDSMQGVYAPGTEDLPTSLKLLDSMPGITTTTLWNVGRVRNTMLGGSKAYRRGNRRFLSREFLGPDDTIGRGGFVKQGFSNTFRPSRFRRFTRAAAIDSAAYADTAKMYSPFQAARLGNAIVSGDMSKIPLIGSRLSGKPTSYQGKIAAKLGIDPQDKMPAFSSGLLGRIAVNSDLATMSPKKFQKIQGKLMSSLEDIANNSYAIPNTASNIASKSVGFVGETVEEQIRSARLAVTNSVRSQVGGKIMGYIDTATEYETASKLAERAERKTAVTVGRRAAKQAARNTGQQQGMAAATSYADDLATDASKAGGKLAIKHLKEGKMLAKIAPKAGLVAKALGPLGTALMIKDAMKFVGTGVGAAIRTGLEAAESAIGSIDKPIMGMGYRDNSVAATSRQRGVMAIQNSQLNARSILGSEASGLHAHFG